MSHTMTAALMYEPGDVRVEQVNIPPIGPDDLLIKVAACGVCGSDIPRMTSSGAYRYPLICGHEFSGHVVDAGANVKGFAQGDLVSVPPLLPCRTCASCGEGAFSLCEDYDYFGSRRNGAYAQFVDVPANNALLMPARLDPRAAAMIDPSAIALHALLKCGDIKDRRVAVLGAGPIGLFAIQWAKLRGAGQVLALDVSAQKAIMARQAGADLTACSSEEALASAHRGFDVVIETAGVPATIALASNLGARHGHAAFIGIPHSTVALDEATFNNFLRHEISLHGSWNSFSAPFPGAEWTDSADALADESLKWEFMITHELALDLVPSTIKQLAARSIFSSKVLFLPNAG